MIERYSRPEMRTVWSDESRLQIWQRIEFVVCQHFAKTGVIPKREWGKLKKSFSRLEREGGLDPRRVLEIEKVTRHETLAFTTALAERLGPESRYVHFGLTSSDVLDTGLALQLGEATRLILLELDRLVGALRAKATRYAFLPAIGRSHGIYAEPTSFGLKFLGWSEEFSRARERVTRAAEGLRVGKLSGAVGVNAHLSPREEREILKGLGLRRESISTQVLPRDRHAEFILALAMLGTALERMSVELRHLQRTEVDEVREGFQSGQKGSSAMPHKRNPISSENLTGAARLLRGFVVPALESVALWHERDMSHSSVERVTFPDATILAHYALNRASGVIEALEVREETIQARVREAGQTVFSGHVLLALVKAGVSREEAYRWIQAAAHKSLDENLDFGTALGQNPEVASHLTRKELERLTSVDHQLRNVPSIYRELGIELEPSAGTRKRQKNSRVRRA